MLLGACSRNPPILGLELPTSRSTFGPVTSRTKSELTRIRGVSLRRAVYIGAVSYWTPDFDLLDHPVWHGYRDSHHRDHFEYPIRLQANHLLCIDNVLFIWTSSVLRHFRNAHLIRNLSENRRLTNGQSRTIFARRYKRSKTHGWTLLTTL